MVIDIFTYLALLIGVVGLPWMLLACSLRADARSILSYEDEAPARHAALLSRFQNLG